MPTVNMGNTAALDRGESLLGNRVTQFMVPDGGSVAEAVRSIADSDGAWSRHSQRPPAWVESDDRVLAEAVSDRYGCPVGRPYDWEG